MSTAHPYVDAALAAFDDAARRLPVTTRTVCVGGHEVRIHAAGTQLPQLLFPALAHLALPTPSPNSPALNILAWDEAESGVALPPSALTAVEGDSQGRVVDPSGRYSGRYLAGNGTLHLYDSVTQTAVYGTRHAADLPTYVWGAPLLEIFRWWSERLGMVIVHAGCVGLGDAGVLLAGKGGSGKSTTTLLALAAGLRYVSDDYCLITLEPEPVAHSLYSVGKLTRDHLRHFPEFERISRDPGPDIFQKPVCFLADHFPDRMARRLRLTATLLPQVVGNGDTVIRATGRMTALRSLAPSTLLQLPNPSAGTLNRLSRLAQALPAATMHLGALPTVVPALKAYLTTDV